MDLLHTLLEEYGQSLLRIADEKAQQTALALRAKTECGVAEKSFRKLAVARYRDTTAQEQKELETHLALFERVQEEAPHDR